LDLFHFKAANMFRNLFLHSYRALKKQRSYVIINVGGLAIGMACSLLIGLFIVQQRSYDNYHEHKDRIFQLVLNGKIADNDFMGGYTAPPIGPTMMEELPEVENFLRLNKVNETVIKYEERSFIENQYLEADSTFFRFFSIRLIRGEEATALAQPYSVVVSESTAKKMFGDEDPMGKMLRIGIHSNMYSITGIMEDVPQNTHFRANMIGSFSSNPSSESKNWLANSFSTYVMLHRKSQQEAVHERIQQMIQHHAGPQVHAAFGIEFSDFLARGNRYSISLQPLTSIQLNPAVEQNLTTPNDPRYLKIFGTIGLLILIIAAINFMNLSTAQATQRAKEVVVKKVSGSSQSLLIWQFLIETIFLAQMAMLLSLLITELALPLINNVLESALTINYFSPWYFIPAMFFTGAVIGILSGIYPAFYLSSFNPIQVLKGRTGNGNDLINLRRTLTTMQFAISIVLIVGTLIMYRQINYMLNKPLGFEKDHVIVLNRAFVLGNQVKSFKNELLTIPGIAAASASTSVPGKSDNNNGHMIVGRPDETFVLITNWVDIDYFKTYGLEVSEGRFFDEESLDQRACIINHCTLKKFNITDALAAQFMDSASDSSPLPVIGVVRDYHIESLRQEIKPHILKVKPQEMNASYMSIRILPGTEKEVIDRIKNLWDEFTSKEPMIYYFLDDNLNRLYSEERQNASLAVIFTFLAIIIASLGLFGLTSFSISQKTKEIGIRKTFGASTYDIWNMLIRESILLIFISTAVAWPMIFWIAENWLENYYYRISLNVFDFISGLTIAIAIAVVTISYKALKAAAANPSLSLRYE
jgi:putative ABC transport system permease protein